MPLVNEDIVGYQVCADTSANVVTCVTDWLHEDVRNCRVFACLNPHSAEVAAGDPGFHNALISADILTPDGIGIVYASRLLGGSLSGRVTGMDVFEGLMTAMDRAGDGRCFFLGSTEETLSAIRDQVATCYPGVQVCGTYSPPFKPDYTEAENQAMIDAINASGADVLWVGLTAPKQEKWLAAHREKLDVKFAGAIGAVFDFFVGNVRRVSPFWGRLGFEWLPRLLQQPGRLWRRTFVSAPKFVIRTIRYRYRKPSQ